MTAMGKTTDRTWAITGPTSGIGHAAVRALLPHGHLVLVGRNPERLERVREEVVAAGGAATCVQADMADLDSVARAADELAGFDLDGILLNAGTRLDDTHTTADGLNLTMVTNFLGPFVLTEALAPRLHDGAHLVYTVSASEDPARTPASMAGFRGGRWLSADDALHGRWAPGGSKRPGFDAYATSKQALLASVLEFARQDTRLRYDAVEPGIIPSTGLEGTSERVRGIVGRVLPHVAPRVRYVSTPDTAAGVLATVLLMPSGTGGYFNEDGEPMHPSAQVQDAGFGERVVAQTREFLAGR